MVEVFIPSVEEMATAKEFVIHGLVLDLNHLDRVYEDLRSFFEDELKFFNGIIYLCYLFNKDEFHISLK